MELPYSIAAYREALVAFNTAWFPAPIIAPLILVAAAAIGRLRGRWHTALIGYSLALVCAFAGWAHELTLMADFNFLAPVYGWAWITQGVLLAIACGVPGAVRFTPHRRRRINRAVVGIVALGLIGYPLAALATGFAIDALPVAGMAPTPTAVVMAGLLAVVSGRWSLALWPVPVLWAGVAAMTGMVLEFWPDIAAAAAIAAAFGVYIRRRGWTP